MLFRFQASVAKPLGLVLCLLASIAWAQAASAAGPAARKLKVFVMAGQSNMEGHADVGTFDYIGDDPATAPLLEEMRGPDGQPTVCKNVWISYLTTDGVRQGPLTAGYGALGGAPKIGPEFTYGLTMENAIDGPVLIIKTAWGGKSLHTDFRPPGAGPYQMSSFEAENYPKQTGQGGIPPDFEQWKAEKKEATGRYYRLMVEHVKKVLADLKQVVPDYDASQGYELCGFVWFQGWNDLVDRHAYPDYDSQPDRYDLYSKLLAQFIRDVRKDLDAPRMPFVIGVVGIEGVKTQRPSILTLRRAMAAPAALPEFRGNVVAVETAPFWSDELGAIDYKRSEGQPISPAEESLWKRGGSNQGYHYLGCAKTFALMGRAFAEANLALLKTSKFLKKPTPLKKPKKPTAATAPEKPAARPAAAAGDEARPAGEKIYLSCPEPDREAFFGCIGATGVMARVHPGMKVKVEKTMPGSPAEGKFAPGDIITGINGTALAGLNPFVALGDALTAAEAADGRMVFDVTSPDGNAERQETVTVPVLGRYGKTWPLDCAKSKQIVEQAAAFYADPAKFKQGGIPGSLACLFLLSTGDDRYLPAVKAYFAGFPQDVRAIGMHTWNNGYNGIACGEYYLRTGDAAVLPILQYYCDDARDRQKFGCSWGHWDQELNPGYVAGGLVNAAGAQLLTTLLLGKECGVNVDEETLLGALRLFYRFAGRGVVPYGDHRGEGGLGSNGKDGMIAAAMQIATGASGDVTIYEEARQALAVSMIDSYPTLATGHGDEGRGDGIWRGITTAYMAEEKPALYREAMDRLTWWHDLSREPGGSIGIATLSWGNGEVGASGPGIGLSYTAPRRTLRITGGPPTRHSKRFTLPPHLWGTEADRAFLSIDHNPKYLEYGPEEPVHVPFYALGSAYLQPAKALESLPRETLLKNVYHRNFMIRAQAGKALRKVGGYDELERLLRDADPRVRRAALDGLTDYNYWFGIGRDPIPTDKLTPAMLESITRMLSDRKESWWVVDAALMAMKFAPPPDIRENVKLILPWTKHADWWLRESAFEALTGLERDETLYLEILPTLLKMANDEYHTMPRGRMLNHLRGVLSRKTPASAEGKLIVAGLEKAIATSEIKSGVRSSEGAYNVLQACQACVQTDPGNAVAIARLAAERMHDFSTNDLIDLVATPNARPDRTMSGLSTALATLAPKGRAELTDVLYTVYRPEFIRRMPASGADQALLGTIIDLTRLKNPAAGWKPLGTTPPAERVWRFRSFDPLTEKDRLHPREGKRFRDIELPDDLKGWQEPGYDDSAWQQGRAPIGVGLWKREGISFANRSDWGKGEFLVMRTTFEVDDLDFDVYRLSILARQGFRVFLNGHEISSYVWWTDIPHYAARDLGGTVAHLKKGTNVLAAYGNVAIDPKTHEPCGQMDLCIEGLRMSELKEQPE